MAVTNGWIAAVTLSRFDLGHPMTWPGFLRSSTSSNRSLAMAPAANHTVVWLREGERRHPAMVGLAVSPVHGWHCSCAGCTRYVRAAA
jgi:hypothetical protein